MSKPFLPNDFDDEGRTAMEEEDLREVEPQEPAPPDPESDSEEAMAEDDPHPPAPDRGLPPGEESEPDDLSRE
jgi:hypothetical protein